MTTPMDLAPKGQQLLGVLVAEIERGRFKPREPSTFISYGEALDKLGIPRRGLAGQQLMTHGLKELNEWTKSDPRIPKIEGLIVDQRRKEPGVGFVRSHGRSESDVNWKEWWLSETERAIHFDGWRRYLTEKAALFAGGDASVGAVNEGAVEVDYRRIITIEPGKRGGKPCIRGMRITVGDVLGWLAAGMSHEEIRSDFPELTEDDIRACLAFAAEKETHAVTLG
jgi:uncharacterized protein (DUF433 family)